MPAGTPPVDFKLTLLHLQQGDFELVVTTYILEPDGTLRAATGPGHNDQTYPQLITTITSSERQLVYDAARIIDFQPTPADIPHRELYSRISVVVYANGKQRQVDQYYRIGSNPNYREEVEAALDLEGLLSLLSKRKLIDTNQ